MNNPSICVDELIRLIQTEDTLILDVRDKQNFTQLSIPNAQHACNENAANLLANYDKNHAIVVCCYHGISSLTWVDMIAREGYTKVYSLQGGFEAWKQADGEAKLKAALNTD